MNSDSEDEGAALITNQTITLAAMQTMIDAALQKQNESLQTIINNAVQAAIAPLKGEIAGLKAQLKEKETEAMEMAEKIDDLEQYTRRNSLVVTGVTPLEGEDTDETMIRIAKDHLGIDIMSSDIDRSHPLGKPNDNKPRPIIVKFATYNVRRKVYKNRVNLKNVRGKKIFINEHLTKPRNEIAYKARKMVKEGKLMKTWTFDGKIFLLKHGKDQPFVITSMREFNDLNL